MRRLERAPNRQLALDLVERSKALAGFKWTGVNALVGDELLYHHLGLLERGVGRFLVADLPGEDVVMVLALAVRAFRLVLDVLAQHRRVRRHRPKGIDQ